VGNFAPSGRKSRKRDNGGEVSQAKLKTVTEYFSKNAYPGRGILIGKSQDGKNAVMAYFIMGRSENSRNRVFVEDGAGCAGESAGSVGGRAGSGGIRTKAFDEAKLSDPSLVIYSPVRVLGEATGCGASGGGVGEVGAAASAHEAATSASASAENSTKLTVVTNGDQTDTIYDFLKAGKTFEDALRTRRFEPDGPIFTPRISGICEVSGGNLSYKLSILKSSDLDKESCDRFFYEYAEPIDGVAHAIHTYKSDGNPVPSFEGEPQEVVVGNSVALFAEELWESLNTNNKVSLFVRFINLEASKCETVIFNKNES
jgi:IMP cyclohydrolase